MDSSDKPMRQDGARNRELLVITARRLFAERGADVPLEDIAQAAGVSRTTLYRNFPTRFDLFVTVLEDNVARIEQQSLPLRDQPNGVVQLLSLVMDMQQSNRSLSQILAGQNELLTGLGERTAEAFRPLARTARAAGVLRPGVTVADLMLAMQMAQAALIDGDPTTSARSFRRARKLLFAALFTTSDPVT